MIVKLRGCRSDQRIVDVVVELPGAVIFPGGVIFADEDSAAILTKEPAATLGRAAAGRGNRQ